MGGHPVRVGRRGPRLRELRAGDRGAREGERGGRGDCRGEQLARRRADRAVRQRRAEQTWLRRLASGRSLGAFRALGGARRIRRREPADGRAPRRARLRRSTAARSGSPMPRRRTSSIVFAATQPAAPRPRHQRVPRADGHARPDARRERPIRSACADSAAWISS